MQQPNGMDKQVEVVKLHVKLRYAATKLRKFVEQKLREQIRV